MKVLHITQKLPGGPASYLSEILPYQIDRLGAENVGLVACGAELSHLRSLPAQGVHPFRASGRGARDLADFAMGAMRVIRRERPDIVHLHSTFPGLLRIPIALLPARRRPAVVYCAHGWAFNMATAGWKKALYCAVEKVLAPLGASTIAISAFEQRSALKRGIPADNLVLVENGIDEAVPSAGAPAASFDPQDINLLFIGRLDRQKGFDLLYRAMQRIADRPVHLHVIGASVVGGAQDYRACANVTFHGWKDRTAIPGFIDKADAVVMPSRWEGFGLVAVEAMRQGCPVVASDVDALPDVVGETGIVFRAGDEVALADVLAGLSREPLRVLGQAARERFLARFTSQRMNREILECYEDVLERTQSDTARKNLTCAR